MASATVDWASSVDAARCGVTITWSSPSSGCPAGSGSCSKTSRAAPPTRPARIAAASAASLTTPPRAQLMIRTPAFIRANCASSMKFRVSLLSGVWIETKSDRWNRSSSSTLSTPRRSAASRGR